MDGRRGGAWNPSVVAQNIQRGGHELSQLVPEIGQLQVREMGRIDDDAEREEKEEVRSRSDLMMLPDSLSACHETSGSIACIGMRTRGAGHRFPWPASRTVQRRRRKSIACPTCTQFIHLFLDKHLVRGAVIG